MQSDFHHGVIYVLCRLAGMESRYAEKVAYASQQVDDAIYNHALKFKDGGIFHQTRTAHKRLAIFKMADLNDAFNVWIPFHFLPSADGDNIRDSLITRPNSSSISLLKKEVISAAERDYGIHWLGIFLHLYADSFSHQDFKGFYSFYNRVRLLRTQDKISIKIKILALFFRIFKLFMPIGHALAGKYPDIPYARWSFKRNGETIEVNNLQQRFLPAVREIFSFIVDYLEENPQYGQPLSAKLGKEDLSKIESLLKVVDSSPARHLNWLDKIHENFFEFDNFDKIDLNLSYDDRDWFYQAVDLKKAEAFLERLENKSYNYYTFSMKKGFFSSDWIMFMRAAAVHRYTILHKVLPKCGMDIA